MSLRNLCEVTEVCANKNQDPSLYTEAQTANNSYSLKQV
jgi:hypothetical protein